MDELNEKFDVQHPLTRNEFIDECKYQIDQELEDIKEVLKVSQSGGKVTEKAIDTLEQLQREITVFVNSLKKSIQSRK